MPFRKTPDYRAYKSTYARTYNRIRVEDFDYVGVLGQGGFGRVVHARKKTTKQVRKEISGGLGRDSEN